MEQTKNTEELVESMSLDINSDHTTSLDQEEREKSHKQEHEEKDIPIDSSLFSPIDSSLFSPIPSVYNSNPRPRSERRKSTKRIVPISSPSPSYRTLSSEIDGNKGEYSHFTSPAQSFSTLVQSPSESFKTLHYSPNTTLKSLSEISYSESRRKIQADSSYSSTPFSGSIKDDYFTSTTILQSPTLTINELKEEEKVVDLTPPKIIKEEKKTSDTITKQKPFVESSTSYIDGIRGLAMIMVFNQHFSSATWLTSHPMVWQTGTAPEILRSKIGLFLFFLISGRLNVTSFFRRKAANKSINWSSLPDGMFRRTIRLAFLTSVALLLQKLECGLGAFYPTMDAEGILQTKGVLWYPGWCKLTRDNQGRVIGTSSSVQDFLSSLVRIFTNFDHKQQLNDNSMLWSMPLQLWGMLYVMMCMPIVINLNAPKRFVFYAIIIVLLGFTYSQYLTFFIGMIVADLRASGLIKKLQHRSRIAFLSVELILAATFFVFLCYNTIEGTIVRALSSTAFDRGVMGINTQEDDFARQPMVLFRASILYLWLEMSVTLQFLVDNFFLRAVGKVGFGFYVSQMSVLYLVIPPMVSKYHKSGDLYWNGIICTWLACFTTNYVVAWVLTKTVDNLGQTFSAWLSKTMAKEGFIGLIKGGVKNTINWILYFPKLCTIDLANSISRKGNTTKQFCHKVANWRTPVPIVPPPEHPLHYGLNQNELHSTLFDADISNDEQAVRTRKVLRLWSFMAPINALIIAGIALVWGLLNPWHGFTTKNVVTFSSIWRAMWLFAVPYCIITFIGFATPDITRTPEQQKKQPVKREFIKNFYILSVTRGSNPEATRRAHEKLKKLEQYHPAVRVCVLTDEPYVYPDLDNIVCPKSYVSPKGLAKHKARALDYFRHTMKLGPYDFVLHMDEESTMDAESLRGCFDFVRYTTHHMGQGIIIYNGHNYWANWKAWLFAVADTIRVGDDLARFSLQTNVIHRPVFGIHGSFLLLNGEAENVVGWDFSSLAEDFEFSQAAWMKGFTLGRVHGIVREQSPEGFQDMLKQRRRWYMGIRQIRGVYYLPQLGIKLWTLGLFCLVATVANLLFSLLIQWSGPSPMWIYTLSVFCFGAFQWLYSGGLLFQELDYGYKLRDAWQVPLHFIALIVIQPFMAAVEACAVVWAMSTEDGEVGFQVVKK